MIFTLAINWANVGIQVAQLLLSLSILVVLHEFGHYITAKWFGCRVEKFYLFFDPWFSVFKKKVGDTEYGIGWLPLGGYVKISGMIDESMDKEAMNQPAKPYEFRSKPAWQRLIIMLGGVIMNVLVAFVIFAMVLYVWGDEKVKYNSKTDGIAINDCLMYELGLRNGDKIITVNGDSIAYQNQLNSEILLGKTAQVLRNDSLITLQFPKDIIGKIMDKGKGKMSFVDVQMPPIAGDFDGLDSSNAKLAGLKKWDKIIAINNNPVQYHNDIKLGIIKSPSKDGVMVKYVRNNTDTIASYVKLNKNWQIGFPYLSANDLDSLGYINIVKKQYSLLGAFPAGVAKTGEALSNYVKQFKKIVNPETGAYKAVGGFRNMGRLFGTSWDWRYFWTITGILSVILAFMNLLPIPGLDGGHVMFTLWEMITRRKPSDKFMERAQVFGMVILLSLMVFANGNDWFGWGRGKDAPKVEEQRCLVEY